MSSWPSIAIVGAGMGGLATAAALHRRGIGVTVYEQARGFARLGAGIQIGCNAMQVLRGLGLERRMRQEAFCPRSWNNRDAGTGAVRYDQIFGASAEQKYGAPYLLAHRGDLHAALASAVPADRIRLGHQVTGLDEDGASAVLRFAGGGSARHDAVVAADGVHSLLLDGVADQAGLSDAFRRFEATRKGRTSRVQLTSRANTWLRGKTDVDWVYSYNPWTAPLSG